MRSCDGRSGRDALELDTSEAGDSSRHDPGVTGCVQRDSTLQREKDVDPTFQAASRAPRDPGSHVRDDDATGTSHGRARKWRRDVRTRAGARPAFRLLPNRQKQCRTSAAPPVAEAECERLRGA